MFYVLLLAECCIRTYISFFPLASSCLGCVLICLLLAFIATSKYKQAKNEGAKPSQGRPGNNKPRKTGAVVIKQFVVVE